MNSIIRQARHNGIAAIQRVRHSVRENRLVSAVIGDARDGNIWALFVDLEHERRGDGRLLHDTMLDWLWSQGLNKLWLTTGPGTRAEHFYRAAGGQRVGPTRHGEIRYEMNRA